MNEEELKAKVKELEDEIKQLDAANGTDKARADRLAVLNKRLAKTVEDLQNVEETEKPKQTLAELHKKIKDETATNEEIIRFGIENAEALGIDADVLKGDTPDQKFDNLQATINGEFRRGGI